MQKTKKLAAEIELKLVRNPDIISAVAKLHNRPFVLGFAAETEHLEQYATEKRIAKGLDMIAANLVGLADTGMESDYNAVTLLWQDGKRLLDKAPKDQIATLVVDQLVQNYRSWKGN
jgi:phosphopantothenoylcysteine decarboxylase/phosphopantothenate--cysteine ligase